jgi:hypothetical protein
MPARALMRGTAQVAEPAGKNLFTKKPAVSVTAEEIRVVFMFLVRFVLLKKMMIYLPAEGKYIFIIQVCRLFEKILMRLANPCRNLLKIADERAIFAG